MKWIRKPAKSSFWPIQRKEIELESVAQDALDLVDGQMNILLLGIDARPGQESGRSDTDFADGGREQKTVKLTSFMRDLYVEIPGYKNNRLNAAYRFGGPGAAVRNAERELRHRSGSIRHGEFHHDGRFGEPNWPAWNWMWKAIISATASTP